MRFLFAVVAVLSVLSHGVLAQTATSTNGRIDRTIDVQNFDDFDFYFPNSTTEIAIYAQWSNSNVIVLDDITLLCLYGPDGEIGGEDDAITFSDSRNTSYKVTTGKLWYGTSVSGNRCWLTLDFEHKDQYDLSASGRFTIILSERNSTEGTWSAATLHDLQLFDRKQLELRGVE